MTNTTYQFGDSRLAADRLALLANVFEPSSREFLAPLAVAAPRRVVDAGCGPGYTTRMLAELFPTAIVTGVDTSAPFVAMARLAARERTQYEIADVSLSLPAGSIDLIYCRYLLTHLPRPADTIKMWGTCLASGGRIAIEENEHIETREPALARYIQIVEAMLANAGQDLYIGAQLARHSWQSLVCKKTEVAPVVVDGQTAARMFLMNLGQWRRRPYIQRNHSDPEIDALRGDLQALAVADAREQSITFWHRRLLLEKMTSS